MWWGKEVCYDHIGCFSNASPFTNAYGKIPESPEHMQPRFDLFTRRNPFVAQGLKLYNEGSISDSNFNGEVKTVVIIHGFQDEGESPWIEEMVEELLKKVMFCACTIYMSDIFIRNVCMNKCLEHLIFICLSPILGDDHQISRGSWWLSLFLFKNT